MSPISGDAALLAKGGRQRWRRSVVERAIEPDLGDGWQ